jgi:hypothetical protein
MADPQVRSFDRLGTVAYETTRSWASSRVKTGTFDSQAQQMLLDGVRHILDGDASTFVIPVYALLSGPIGAALPGTRELLAAEAVNPRRNRDEIDHAASVLRAYTTDLSQVRAWLFSSEPREMWAGVALLDHIDHSLIQQTRDELPMLLAVAKRRDVPADVALGVIEHVKGHADAAFLPVLHAFSANADTTVREAAALASTEIQKAEDARR